jgi:hypothetical protein
VNVTGKGLVVFTACSHAGVINVLRHARDSFPGTPLYAVMGGFHLSGPNEGIIPQTVEAMRAFNLSHRSRPLHGMAGGSGAHRCLWQYRRPVRGRETIRALTKRECALSRG